MLRHLHYHVARRSSHLMVAVERPLGRRLRSLVWAYGLAPQFAPQAWRLGGLFTVAVVTYAVYVWSPLVGRLALSVAGAVVPALGQLPQSISMMFVVVVCAFATVGTVLWLSAGSCRRHLHPLVL